MSFRSYIEAIADVDPEPEPDRPPLRTTQAAGGGIVLFEERDADTWIHAETDSIVDVREVAGDE